LSVLLIGNGADALKVSNPHLTLNTFTRLSSIYVERSASSDRPFCSMCSEYKAQLQAERVPVYERRSRTAAVISAYSNAELGLKPKINTGSAAFDFPILLDPGQTVKFRVADRRLKFVGWPARRAASAPTLCLFLDIAGQTHPLEITILAEPHGRLLVAGVDVDVGKTSARKSWLKFSRRPLCRRADSHFIAPSKAWERGFYVSGSSPERRNVLRQASTFRRSRKSAYKKWPPGRRTRRTSERNLSNEG